MRPRAPRCEASELSGGRHVRVRAVGVEGGTALSSDRSCRCVLGTQGCSSATLASVASTNARMARYGRVRAMPLPCGLSVYHHCAASRLTSPRCRKQNEPRFSSRARACTPRWRRMKARCVRAAPSQRVLGGGSHARGGMVLLLQQDTGRVDDLWSLWYILVDLALGRCPWRKHVRAPQCALWCTCSRAW